MTDSPQSLATQLPTIEANIDALNELAGRLCAGEPERALTLSKEALQLAINAGYILGRAASRRTLARLYGQRRQWAQALDYARQAQHDDSLLADPAGQIQTLLILGEITGGLADFTAAAGHLLAALELASRSPTHPLQSECHLALANLFKQQGDFGPALTHFEQYHHLTVARRRQAEAEAQRRAAKLAVLAEVGHQITAVPDLPTVLKRIASRAKELLLADNIAIFIHRPYKNSFDTLLALGPDAPAINNFAVLPGRGIMGHILQTARAEIIENTAADPRVIQIPNTGLPNETLMCAPLPARHQIIGLMALWRSLERGPFEPADLDFLAALARQAAIAIERARLVNEAEEARQAAATADKTKSTFLAKMSHELRTPLNSILGFAQLLGRSPNLDADSRETVRIIQRSGEHLLTLINDVLNYARLESGQSTLNEQEVDLFVLLESLKEMFQLRANEKQLRLEFNHGTNVPRHIRTDEAKLREVLINLLGNALKFTQTGAVSVQVHRAEFSGAPNSLLAAHYALLRFEVSDTGPGIAPHKTETLFKAFEHKNPDQPVPAGTGLGLAISHKFVQMMGGKIAVDSQPGQGATFCFEITVGLVEYAADDLHLSQGLAGVVPVDLSLLPADIVAELALAARQTDMARINQLIDRIRDTAPDVAGSLASLAYNFEYDRILALLGAN